MIFKGFFGLDIRLYTNEIIDKESNLPLSNSSYDENFYPFLKSILKDLENHKFPYPVKYIDLEFFSTLDDIDCKKIFNWVKKLTRFCEVLILTDYYSYIPMILNQNLS